DIQVAKLLVDAPVEAGAREEIPIGLRRGRESAGDAHPDLPELSDHLPQGCVLAADHVDVLHPKVLQIDDVRIHLKQAPSQVRRALHDNESNPFYTAAVEVHSRGTASCTARAQEAFQMSERTVFFLSDQTGVTAETLGHSLLTQFDSQRFRQVTLPFIDNEDKAREAVRKINDAAEKAAVRPIVFSTLVQDDVRAIVREANGLHLD